MSRIEEIKEQLVDNAKVYWDRIQNSNLYMQGQEKYEELNPRVQKLLKFGIFFFAAYIVLNIPFSWMKSANQNIEAYERNRNILESLIQVQNDLQQSPDININVNMNQIKTEADALIQRLGVGEDQITSSRVFSKNDRAFDFLPEDINYSGLAVELRKLNLNQILDVGSRLQNMNRNAKLLEVDIQAHPEDNHYYNVTFVLTSFSGLSSQ